jgi:TrmH family RNA methyltransferase
MIVSRQNQKIKDIRRLRRCKGDRAILEGPHLVREAIQAGLELESILASPEFLATPEGERLNKNLAQLITVVAPDLIEYLSDADSPRGVMAVLPLPRESIETLPVVEGGLYLFVDGIQDPGNLGALVRVAEAFGISAVVLAPGSVHPNHPRSLRASAGSLLRMRIFTESDAHKLSKRLADLEPTWLVLTPNDGVPLEDVQDLGTRILAVGAEGPGVSSRILEVATTRVTIPLSGQVESLNSTVAAAIALYGLTR